MTAPVPHNQSILPGLDGNDDPPFLPEPTPGNQRLATDHLLFFAFLPPPAVAPHIERFTNGVRQRHQLLQPAMPAERLHMTLLPIIGFQHAIPSLIVSAAIDAGSGIASTCRSLPIKFNRVGSLGLRAPAALVLLCDTDSRQGVSSLRGSLALSLRRRGFPATSGSAPHMTLVYGTDHVDEQPIEPICWTASRLVLILSHRGKGHHQHVREWPLLDRGW